MQTVAQSSQHVCLGLLEYSHMDSSVHALHSMYRILDTESHVTDWSGPSGPPLSSFLLCSGMT